MPIPRDAHGVPGNPNRVRLSDGEIVTRHQALNLGAKEQGFESHKAYLSYRAGDGAVRDANHYNAWKKGRQGRDAIAKEKAIAKSEGRRYSDARMRQRFLAARNTRPHRGREGGEPFLDFIDRYDLDRDDWIDY